MGLPASRRKNIVVTPSGRRIRLPDVPGVGCERRWWDEGARVAGVDEVGRGAWAGPVTYAAVILPSHRRMYKLRDSKLLDPQRREELAARLEHFALGIGMGQASNTEIDRLGMSAAMQLAAARAVAALPEEPDICLLDGTWNFLASTGRRAETIAHGDAHSASIAAASVLAKVARDRLMRSLCRSYPAYAFSSNKGYPSPEHVDALNRVGPCSLHRRTWAPITALAQGRLDMALDGYFE